ncbi:MAG: oxidoreductase [Spirochaetaceae bacterium]|nr:oxidoreductase [Spirochaetaceae bacterium]|tara:strand:- start:34561 stop:35469 length:909 start_codon:yes stop_codon:yes gene_type:complete
MKKKALSKDGPKVSPFIYGCWRLLDDPEGSDIKRVREKIDACLESGITTFDHADIYGGYGCEEVFGNALKDSPNLRDKMEIVTKCGIMLVDPARPDNRIKHYNHSGNHVIKSAERSLKNLNVDTIDLLLIHRPGPLMDPEELGAALDHLRKAGKIKYYGVSNFTTSQFKMLNACTNKKLATNQIEMNPVHQDPFLDGTLDYMVQKQIRPMAWSPTAGGAIFNDSSPQFVRLRETLQEIAGRYGMEMDQVLYSWLLMHPSQPAVVLGTNRPERIKKSIEARSRQLEYQDWYAIWSAASGEEVP